MAELSFTEGGVFPPQPREQPKQLLPNMVDGMAAARPEALYAEIPKSLTSYEAGYQKITYRDLANAINGIAWLLRRELGEQSGFPTLIYIGPNDISYMMVILGAVKAGFKILCLSPLNTVDDNLHLIRSTNCRTLLTIGPPYPPTASAIKSADNCIRMVSVPPVNVLLNNRYDHFPYPKTFQESKDEPLVVVHTSGTTGTPKPITYTHDFGAAFNMWLRLPPPEGLERAVDLISSNRVFSLLPFFHAGSIFLCFFNTILNQTTVVTPLGGVPPSAKLVIDALDKVDVDALYLIPTVMEELAKNPEMVQVVNSKVKTIIYAGGDISRSCGEAFSSSVTVLNQHGSTEIGGTPTLRAALNPDPDDWRYIQPHPNSGIEFREFSNDLYEAVIVKHSDPNLLQAVFKLFPDLNEWSTKDLWRPHPRNKNMWAYHGRTDDMIAFKSGALFSPLAYEQCINSCPEVRSTLLTGTGRFQPTLLVEPAAGQDVSDAAKRQELVNKIWPAVEEANEKHARGFQLKRAYVIVASPDKPFKRVSKGTVQRASTVLAYGQELEELYQRESDALPQVSNAFIDLQASLSVAEL